MRSAASVISPILQLMTSRELMFKGLRRIVKGKKKKPPKIGNMSDIAWTQIDQSIAQVATLVREDMAKRILVNGDKVFFDSAVTELAGLDVTWCSLAEKDVSAGAKDATAIDAADFDAVIVGGPDVGTRYRFTLREAQRRKNNLAVHWVAEKFVFCRGVVSAPSEADDVEALVFNHFERYFSIKDPLMFRIEIYHGPEMKRVWRILRPNESVVVKVSDYFPVRRHATAISTMVTHPYLTMGRHIRYRVCADVMWKGSFTTLHSAHEFRRTPTELVETRVAQKRVRDGTVVITLPNYEQNVPITAVVGASDGVNSVERRRDPSLIVDETRINLAKGGNGKPFVDCYYNGYGGSFWFAVEDVKARKGAKNLSCIMGNHHVQNPRRDLINAGMSADEHKRFLELRSKGFVVEPHPLPVTHGKGPLRWGFDCDTSNPPFWNFMLYWFGKNGEFLGEMPYHKQELGTVFVDDLVKLWKHPKAKEATLVCFTPDWTKDDIRRKGFRLLADLVVEHVDTGDRDVTEFQSAWRNLGTIFPDFPHWLTPAMGAVGRTNLFARCRSDKNYRSAILAINASGRLDYNTHARAEVVIYNLAGKELRGELDIKPFGWSLEWLDELIPGVNSHLGAGGVGAMMLVSPDADLCAQVVSTNANKAVALQHLWGY
jgi:hypothetical protein